MANSVPPIEKTARSRLTGGRHSTKTIEFGDFQTPVDLALRCAAAASADLGEIRTVVEPTCGQGAFLTAAVDTFPSATILGFDVNDEYVRLAAEHSRTSDNVVLRQANFFSHDWPLQREKLKGPVLYLGNPPWVTNSQLGSLSADNLPRKSNLANVRGIEALTGHSNFDIAESILRTLIETMRPADCLAMLVKTATARNVLKAAWSRGMRFDLATLRLIDAKREFNVNVDACLLTLRKDHHESTQVCRRSPRLSGPADAIAWGWFQNQLVADPRMARETNHLHRTERSPAEPRWRSGVKHDAASVLELNQLDGDLCNRAGTRLDIEGSLIYPLAKGADVAHGRTGCEDRRILLPQRHMKDDTSELQSTHPRTWRYLKSQEELFRKRKSSIYRRRDRFAIFGIGEYTFAPWKVAICGLYKHWSFHVFGPVDRRPVIFDDTSYFLALRSRRQAELVWKLLNSEPAREFLEARVFWDAKRPVTAGLLGRLDLAAVARQLGWNQKFEAAFLR